MLHTDSLILHILFAESPFLLTDGFLLHSGLLFSAFNRGNLLLQDRLRIKQIFLTFLKRPFLCFKRCLLT